MLIGRAQLPKRNLIQMLYELNNVAFVVRIVDEGFHGGRLSFRCFGKAAIFHQKVGILQPLF